MKGIVAVSGMALTAAAMAVLVSTSRVGPTAREHSPRLAPAPRPQAERTTPRRCVRLGWNAPGWYSGAQEVRIPTRSTPRPQRIPWYFSRSQRSLD
jgi:hypothetical protein